MPALDTEAFVPRGIARGDQHVVDPRCVVLLEREDRTPPVRDEVLAGPREEPVDVRPRVLRAVVLARVVGDERPRVRDLPSFDIDHAQAPTRLDPHGAPLARRDVDRLRDAAIIRGGPRRADSAQRPGGRRYRPPVEPPRHRPLDALVIPRFAGVRTFMRLPHTTDLAGVDAAAIGIPFDTATSYRTGARFGPEAIRSASALLRPFHPAFGINLVDTLSMVDFGDVPVAPGDTEGTYRLVEDALTPIVEAGVFPLVMGGDHSVTLAELRALARVTGPLALVQLDSHTDTWDAYFGQQFFHGTTFKRAAEERLIDAAASVQAGMRGSLYGASDLEDARALGFQVIPSEELRTLGPERYGAAVRERVGERPVFLSFDIDFLDPAFAPGTGTPEVAGFSTAEAVALLRALRGIRLAGADVVEVSPAYDGAGQPTAVAAANVLWELLALRAAGGRRPAA